MTSFGSLQLVSDKAKLLASMCELWRLHFSYHMHSTTGAFHNFYFEEGRVGSKIVL